MSAVLRKKVVISLFIIGTFLTLWGVNYAFVGIYNTNNNYLSLAARNYERFGFITLKLFPTYFAGHQFTPGIPYYLHHPILIFLLSALPMIVFTFQNWSVHVTNFLFVVGDVAMIYLIARRLWGTRVALWAAGLSAIFPMATFFWKYIFFEQASLFFNLVIYYWVLRYLDTPSRKTLSLIFIFTLLSGFLDWGVLYLLFPLTVFYFSKYKKNLIRPFVVYLFGTGLSLGAFVAGVYVLQHGFRELGGAIWARSYTSELTGLSVWPLRLFLITLIRTVLYFTPIAVASVWIAYKKIRKDFSLSSITLLVFFLFGCLNLLFLPAASWGHSYFLYYFIPFFAFTGGLYLETVEKKRGLIWLWIMAVVITSIGVNFLKIQQVEKQLWKYDVAVQVNKTLAPYETIGVVNFAGDVFENYFFHPSQPIEYGQLDNWLKGSVYRTVTKAVYVCEGTCTAAERAKAKALSSVGLVTTYETGGNAAWLITKTANTTIPVTEIVSPTVSPQVQEGSIFLKIYRIIRDTLTVGQI